MKSKGGKQVSDTVHWLRTSRTPESIEEKNTNSYSYILECSHLLPYNQRGGVESE